MNTKEDLIIKSELNFQPPAECLGELYFKRMKENAKRIAQYLPETDEVDTYGDLLQRAIRCALKLKSTGIRNDDVISICSYTHKNTCVPLIAGLFLGIKVAPLDPVLPLNDTTHLLNEICPKIIFASKESIDLLERSLESAKLNCEIVLFDGNSQKYRKFDEFLVPNNEEESTFKPLAVPLNETAVIHFSSGTTGLPKGICLQNGALIAHTMSIFAGIKGFDVAGIDMCDRVIMNYTNIYWVSHQLHLGLSIMHGVPRLLPKQFEANKFWNLINKYKVYSVYLTPSQLADVFQFEIPKGADLSNLKTFDLGAAAAPLPFVLKLRQLCPNMFISQVYGQTEVGGGAIAFFPGNEKHKEYAQQKPGSAGKLCPGFYAKIVDHETEKLLGPNQPGELRLKMDFMMNGYYKRDSSNAFDKDGFVKTGDLFYYDEDYCFYFVDRIKELIKYRTIHVPPVTIENVLYQHPAIQQAVVIGVPHDEDGEHPMAIVQLKDQMESVTANEIVEFVNQQVDNYKKLRAGVKFIKEFPKTATGKISRLHLKKMVREGKI